MSGVCGNCDCADKSQCVKGNQFQFCFVEDAPMVFDATVMEEGGNCDSCKCGAGCSCTNCDCCSH